MKETITRIILISLGWFFIIVGIIGVVLPILPTTPFLILALGLFAKSSPSFHQMLLHNRWFGKSLQQWESKKSISRHTKRNATVLIILSFSISIAILQGRVPLQIFLIFMAIGLLFFIWWVKEH
ncbi:MAG: YbaN family protein [Methylococcales bacterium]|nr:YbaN family protein [Methylococcales bacterium]